MASRRKKGKCSCFAAEIKALLWIWCQDYTKGNTETNTSVRAHKTFTCAIKIPKLGIFQAGKQNEPQNMSKNIYDHILKIIFVRSKFRRTKYAQIVPANGSGEPNTAQTPESTKLLTSFSTLTASSLSKAQGIIVRNSSRTRPLQTLLSHHLCNAPPS